MFRQRYRDENDLEQEEALKEQIAKFRTRKNPTLGSKSKDWMICLFDHQTRKLITVPNDRVFRIGREKDNDIVAPNDFVLRYHCRIENGVYVYDGESANGVYVNGEKLNRSRKILKHEDKLCLGNPDGGHKFTVLWRKKNE